MVSNADIYRVAHMLIERHGAEALSEAAKLLDAMLASGDADGKAVWSRIRQAIIDLRTAPTGSAN